MFNVAMSPGPPDAAARGNLLSFDPSRTSSTAVRRAAAGAVLLLVLAGASFGIGSWPLLDPDEGRNAEVAREMAVTNDYVLPHLNGLPYLDKPVLYFAADAASIEIFGTNEFAVRLPSLLFALLTAGTIAWYGRKVFSTAAGMVAALMFLASPLTVAFARTVIFDTALTLFIVFSIMAFHLAVERPEESGRWATAGWVSMALGILTKGPVALALPLLVAIPYAIWRKKGKRLFTVAGVLLFAAIVAAWVAAVSQSIPDFLHYALVVETFKRLTSNELKRSGPVWYFVPYLLFGAIPWSLAAIPCWRSLRRGPEENRADPRLIFLLLWIVIPFVFFSVSQSKRPQYILPILPAVALLVGHAWSSRGRRLPGLRWGATSLMVIGLVLVGAALAPPLLRKVEPDLVREAQITALALGAVTLLAGFAAWIPRRSVWFYAVLLSIPALALPTITLPLLNALASHRSAKVLVETRPEAWRDSRIISIFAYPPSMSFYSGRTITVVTNDGSELRSNYLRRYPERFFRDNPGEMLRSADFALTARPCRTPEIFVIKRQYADARRQLAAMLPLLAENENLTAFGPCVPKEAR